MTTKKKMKFYSIAEMKELRKIAKSPGGRELAISDFAIKYGRTRAAISQKIGLMTRVKSKPISKVTNVSVKKTIVPQSQERTIIVPFRSIQIKNNNLIIGY